MILETGLAAMASLLNAWKKLTAIPLRGLIQRPEEAPETRRLYACNKLTKTVGTETHSYIFNFER